MARQKAKPAESESSRPLAVVLVSGGMDSLTAAGLARQAGNELAFIHFNYGQRTEVAELRAFGRLADYFEIPRERRLVTHSNFFSLAGGSALTDQNRVVPEADLQSQAIPVTYVPFRNAVLLSQAVSWAEAIGARYVYYGAVSQDSSGYPDCRPEFISAFNTLINVGTRPESSITVKAPLVEMVKADIILTARDLGLPLQDTWSCYSRNDLACGICDSCALRLRGFKQAGIDDPLPYARPETATRLNRVDTSRRERLERLHTLLRALTRAS